MSATPLYIRSAAQISLQSPLCDDWLISPRAIVGDYVRAVDPNFRDHLSGSSSRRMGLVLKRALTVAQQVLSEAGLDRPEAIVVGTGLGCVESTEKFLEALCRTGETLLGPTHFMQSTHNTIASAIAIHTSCHGYNITFSHKAVSFDLALHDAALWLLSEGRTDAFVGAFDEVTPTYHVLLRRMGFVGRDGQVACGEAAAGFLLSTESDRALCRLLAQSVCRATGSGEAAERLSDFLSAHNLTAADIDVVVSGINGYAPHDEAYGQLCRYVCPQVPVVAYKQLFGECYSAPALGFYVACRLLQHDAIPHHLFSSAVSVAPIRPTHILYINHSQSADYAFALLQRI